MANKDQKRKQAPLQEQLTNEATLIKRLFANKLRLILITLGTLSILGNLFLIYKQQNTIVGQTSNMDPTVHRLLDPNLNTLKRESRLMHFSPLKKDIIDYVDSHKDLKISVYFEYLPTGANFSVYVDNNTYPASLTKVPIAIMILNKIQEGKLDWDYKYPILDEYKDSLSGDLFKAQTGTTLTLRQLMEENIVNSDNTAKNILRSLTTPEDVSLLINELGMDKLFDSSGKTTAKEYARVFRSLYYASMLSRDNATYLLDLLTKTKRDTYMATKIPENVLVAHKYGSAVPERGFSDVGIVYIQDRPFLIAITIDGGENKTFDETQARELISTIVKKSYDYVSTAKMTNLQ